MLFAREHVRQSLAGELAFLVYPNQSCDDNPRAGDESVFPGDALPDGEYHGPWPVEQVVTFLWRAGKVPEWIDAAVQAEDGGRTLVGLRCCGRFTANEELLYHRGPGCVAPFSIKSPRLPPGWESVEISGRFDLEPLGRSGGRRRRGWKSIGGTPMRRTLLTLAAVLVAGLLAWEFGPIDVKRCSGSFDLTVRVEGRPRSISCEAFGGERSAEDVLAVLMPPESRRWSAVADPFDGRPLTVGIPVSWRESPLGRQYRRTQFRYLVVIATMPDGERVGKLVDIPDSRVSQEVTVSLP